MKKTLLFIICGLMLAACSSSGQKSENVAMTDSYGREVMVPQNPQRIISLSPAITEIAFLLHCEDRLVGVTDFCDYPPETANIPKVGKLLNINIESLLSLNPDLILIGSVVSKEDVEKMEKARMSVFALKAERHVEEIFQTIATMGKILGKEAEADSLVASYKTELEELQSLHSDGAERKSVYYVVGFGDGGDYTAPGNSYISEIIELAGGRNIAESLTTWNISREFLFEQQPDLIFIRTEDKEAFCRTYPYTELEAVKQGRVFAITSGWIDQLSPRNVEAIKLINAECRIDN